MSAVRGRLWTGISRPRGKARLPGRRISEGQRAFSGITPTSPATIDMACNKKVGRFLASADLILAVGFDAVTQSNPATDRAGGAHRFDANTDQVYPAEVEFVGAIGTVLEAFRAAGSGNPRWSEARSEASRRVIDDTTRAAQPETQSERCGPIPCGGRAAGPSPPPCRSHKLLVGQGWLTHEPANAAHDKPPLVDGFSLPGAIAAKLLAPDRRLCASPATGGFAHGSVGVESARLAQTRACWSSCAATTVCIASS